jgi:diguanylate cyclase (GGDEF)-like protein
MVRVGTYEPGRVRQMARTAAVLFGAAALVTLISVVAPHQPQVETGGLLVVAVAAALAGAVLVFAGDRLPEWSIHALPAFGTALVSFGLLFNGERHGGAAGGDEMYYLWAVLYSAYYLGRVATAAQVVLVALAYTATLVAIDPGPVGVSRWLTTIGLAAGSAVVVRLLSERVDRLVTELRLAASTDPLTGLLNRREFEQRFAGELARARRTGESFALVLGDLDRFKELNDRHGHAAGDEALASLARLLRAEVRAIDSVARIGGDEFAILLPATNACGAREAAARIADRVRRHGGIPTLSAGSAAYGADGHTIEDLMRVADAALYSAKRGTEPRGVRAR